uniref:Chromosome 11 open reading frame 52 n=1 Tax=Junco hyemalis TaxID=40217 RepID=A0A8C5IPW6_JUNHY
MDGKPDVDWNKLNKGNQGAAEGSAGSVAHPGQGQSRVGWPSPGTRQRSRPAGTPVDGTRGQLRNPTLGTLPGSRARAGTRKYELTVPTYEDVADVPVYATVSRRGVQQEESIHYADIQVLCRAQQRSAAPVRSLQQHQPTEYATLNFPRARLKYDSKNGTLV